MSEFLKAKGRIAKVDQREGSNGPYWLIDINVPGKQYPLHGITSDDPNSPECLGEIEFAYMEKPSTKINPKNNKPYGPQRTFYLPNHVRKDGTKSAPSQAPSPKPVVDKMELARYVTDLVSKTILEHEKKFHQTAGLPLEEPNEEIPF